MANSVFGIPGMVEFSHGENDLPRVFLKHLYSESGAEIYLHGATVTQWLRPDGNDGLALRPDADFRGEAPIEWVTRGRRSGTCREATGGRGWLSGGIGGNSIRIAAGGALASTVAPVCGPAADVVPYMSSSRKADKARRSGSSTDPRHLQHTARLQVRCWHLLPAVPQRRCPGQGLCQRHAVAASCSGECSAPSASAL